GRALIAGLRAKGVSGRSILAVDPSTVRRAQVRRLGARATADSCEVACAGDVIVLAVKPQQMASVVSQLAPCISRQQLVVSIAAGITLPWLHARLRGIPLVRVMPNLPATVGQGFSAFTLGRYATARHRAIAAALFGAVGEAVELPERLLDAVTAVSGSGPAYVFYLAHVWEAAAVGLGLPRAIARRAVERTLIGSAALLAGSEMSPEEWIARVASKRGTTEAALRVLARGRVSRYFTDALRAAARRSRALSRRR
ncbi:MAG: pyrroline-5-carboxylate reductase, partial [Candidatus Omnitrophota bacterium]|nr:pyrroline-5-carboxylate reductase [Candidatus Omnitrophota bacterium]